MKYSIKVKALILTLAGLAIVQLSAINLVSRPDGYVVKGSIAMEAGTRVILNKLTPDNFIQKDTFFLGDKGEFEFSGQETEQSIYYITFNTANPPGVPLILVNGDKVKLQIEKRERDFSYTVSGGEINSSMHKLHLIYTRFDDEMQAYQKEVEGLDQNTMTADMQIKVNEGYEAILERRSREIEQFVRTEPASPVIYFAVRFLFSKPEPRLINIAADRLFAAMPESAYTQQLLEYKKKIGPLSEGAMAPNIKLPNPQGDSIELHSLKGKVVLIDFWASWCGPCRKENPYVRELYAKYKDKGFEIYGVSLDNNKAYWEFAIQKDSLNWVHVSDLRAWQSAAAVLYDVHSIPQTYLIDKDGRIYKVGLRAHQLEPVLEYLLN